MWRAVRDQEQVGWKCVHVESPDGVSPDFTVLLGATVRRQPSHDVEGSGHAATSWADDIPGLDPDVLARANAQAPGRTGHDREPVAGSGHGMEEGGHAWILPAPTAVPRFLGCSPQASE